MLYKPLYKQQKPLEIALKPNYFSAQNHYVCSSLFDRIEGLGYYLRSAQKYVTDVIDDVVIAYLARRNIKGQQNNPNKPYVKCGPNCGNSKKSKKKRVQKKRSTRPKKKKK